MNFARLPMQPTQDTAQVPVEPQTEAPSGSDQLQSLVHHVDSIAYNAKHAAAHQQETHAHASAMMKLMKRLPGFAKHARRM